jgi:hypothetical protein
MSSWVCLQADDAEVLQGYCQPWKSPAVNLVDATSHFLFLSLLGLGLVGLESESDWILDILATSVCIGLLVVSRPLMPRMS